MIRVAHRPPPSKPADRYTRALATQIERNRQATRAAQDIGIIPPVADPARKAAAHRSLRLFCESYFPQRFKLAWSADHLKVIATIDRAVVQGGQFAVAMPRGSGKTTICECAVLWAVLTGRHRFAALIGSCEDAAEGMLANIKREITSNALLAEDYPEAIYPIRQLEGEARKAGGQRHHGQRTYVGWNTDSLVMPWILGSRAAGAIIRVAGLTGNLRGMVRTLPDGTRVRPSLAIVDDPQTDQSARSPTQTADRLGILNGAILGMAGPGRKIAALCPCTVIAPGDLADTLLDRQRYPNWQGERTKLVYDWPTNSELWGKYFDIAADGLRSGQGIREATEFYRTHRAEMDAGAVVAWPERFDPDEISAIQHAMNLRNRDEAAFAAEYQNEPLADAHQSSDLTVAGLLARANHHRRRVPPVAAEAITAFVDVQQNALFYLVAAWSRGFTGAIIDYGTWPDQHRRYFQLATIKRTISLATRAPTLEAQLAAALAALTAELCQAVYITEAGQECRIGRLLVDANWGASTDVVYQHCRTSPHAALLLPSHGRYVGASSVPMGEYKRKAGERVGLNWRAVRNPNRPVGSVLYDTNFWKSLVADRLLADPAAAGAITLWGNQPDEHRLLADHLTSEYRVRTEGRGRVVDEWKLRPERPDNHWFDCLVGCAVAASIQGIATETQTVAPPKKSRPHVRYL